MRAKIKTSIIIEASADRIWKTLLDFEKYKEWNPFITSIKGTKKVGGKLEAQFGKMTFKPTVLRMEKNLVFEWKGKLLFGGIFDGTHTFEIKQLDQTRVELVQKENFFGVLIPFMKKMIHIETKNSFIKMNEALKERCEEIR